MCEGRLNWPQVQDLGPGSWYLTSVKSSESRTVRKALISSSTIGKPTAPDRDQRAQSDSRGNGLTLQSVGQLRFDVLFSSRIPVTDIWRHCTASVHKTTPAQNEILIIGTIVSHDRVFT